MDTPRVPGLDDFKTDRGGGVYAASEMAQIHNCTFKENYAAGKGGAIYLSNGRVVSSLVYNNNSDSDGGGIYIDTGGIVLRSLVTNNSAENGAGIYLKHNPDGTSELNRPEYLIVSTSVVANNTSRHNGAVYCDKGGVLMQSTVVNNQCTTSTDQTAENASRTGGVYIDEYAIVTNSILWNNRIRNNRLRFTPKTRLPKRFASSTTPWQTSTTQSGTTSCNRERCSSPTATWRMKTSCRPTS